jgi:hypothetical protein
MTFTSLGQVAADLLATLEPQSLVSDASPRVEYLLAELRCASLRVQLLQGDIEAIGLALKGGLVTAEQAIHLLSDCDALRYIDPPLPHKA